MLAESVIDPKTTHARTLLYRKGPLSTVKQIVCLPIERQFLRHQWKDTILVAREQFLKLLPLRDEGWITGTDQRIDQVLLPWGRLHDRFIEVDTRISRFAPEETFVSNEEKCLIFFERAAECETGLVALEWRVTPRPAGEAVTRIEG